MCIRDRACSVQKFTSRCCNQQSARQPRAHAESLCSSDWYGRFWLKYSTHSLRRKRRSRSHRIVITIWWWYVGSYDFLDGTGCPFGETVGLGGHLISRCAIYSTWTGYLLDHDLWTVWWVKFLRHLGSWIAYKYSGYSGVILVATRINTCSYPDLAMQNYGIKPKIPGYDSRLNLRIQALCEIDGSFCLFY